MKSITINGSKRESVGKVATKALRNAGRVPCVLYGGGEPLHFSAPELDFSKLVYTPNAHTVVINLDGENVAAILQDIQFHPLTDKILHIDFYRLFDDKEVSISKLKLGNKLYTAELQTEEYTLLHPDNTVVCQVRTSRASVKEEDEDDTTTEEGTEGGDTASAAETSEAPAES